MHDTIAAIATPPMASAIGIIRVSGPSTKNLTQRLFRCTDVYPRRMIVSHCRHITTDDILDDCCYVFYEEHASYTGEASLEIFAHGSQHVLSTILDTIIQQPNCRLATNGEFTKRAFLNGRISLTKAESIANIIESTNDQNHQIALHQYNGRVYQTITSIKQRLLEQLQHVEAHMEFPDDVGISNNLRTNLTTIKHTLERIISQSDYGSMIKQGLRYLIIGAPNTGKSSLLNILSGEERSIVSTIPGTTRDYIEKSIQYNGIEIALIDTAGLRETTNEIETCGIKKIAPLVHHCTGIIALYDGSIPICKQQKPPKFTQQKPIIHVINKTDILVKENNLSSYLKISCATHDGIPNLKQTLIDTVIKEPLDHTQMLCNIRQISCLKSAYTTLDNVITLLNDDWTHDIIALDLKDIIMSLGELNGETFTDTLLDGIFSQFCIGK